MNSAVFSSTDRRGSSPFLVTHECSYMSLVLRQLFEYEGLVDSYTNLRHCNPGLGILIEQPLQ